MTAQSATMPKQGGKLARLAQQSEVVLALAVVLIIGMMVVPLPPVVLDLLITVSLSISITILLITMYVQDPMEFSVFPSLLLIVTLFRLSLNISSARLILLNGYAGQVIEAFGNFVVGGNYVVGIVVFLLLMIIQFAVITNGAGRVAEVSARFTLDAMPGKQMSIDADMNAGLITEAEARRRRRAIENEADFYGAMDGASKFVKGDAIAGVAIIIVNILGGFVIGVLQRGLSLPEALKTYTLLTVGDGLVAQIPALLVSSATGIIVTRGGTEQGMGNDVIKQLLGHPRVIMVVGAILLLFGLVPGLPKLPFFLLGGVLLGSAYTLEKRQAKAKPQAAAETAATPARQEQAEDVFSLLKVDPMAVELGYGLIPLVEEGDGGGLLDRISAVRRTIAMELGFVLPKIRIRDDLRLAPNAYAIRLRGETVAEGELLPNRLLAMPTRDSMLALSTLQGVKTQEPVFGLPALWIESSQKEIALVTGCTVVDPSSALTTHLAETIRNHAAELLTRQEVQKLLEHLSEECGALVQEINSDSVGLPLIQKILRNLLQEHVSVRDLPIILETVAGKTREVRDPDVLTEHVRQALSRAICNQYREADGTLYVLTLGPVAEQRMAESIHQTDQGLVTHLSPEMGQQFQVRINDEIEKMAQAGHMPVLLCSSRVRLPLRRFTQRALPQMVVLSYSEVPSGVTVHACGTVEVGNDR